MLDPVLIERIRTIFLHDRQYVTIAEAAEMLGWTAAEMKAQIRNGASSRSGLAVARRSSFVMSRQRRSTAGR
jgi:hypothetical protein